MTVKGVDISGANGNVDFAMLKRNGISFVMINLGNNFADNVKKAEAAGIPWGAYYYTYSLSAAEDKEELDKILGRLAGKKPTYPVAIDVEDGDGYKSRNGGWNYSNVNRNAKYLLEGLAKAGYYPMLYTGFEEINNYISKDVWQKYDMWFAHWAKKCGYTGSNLTMWQFGGETNSICSPYIEGQIFDQNYCYVDYPTIIKNGGYNGWKKPEAELKVNCKKVHTYAWCQYAFGVSGATNPKWTTSNTQISSIDQNGVLSTTAGGTTTVTCSDGKRSVSIPVTISTGKSTGIVIPKLNLAKGQGAYLTAREKDVSWFSSNTKVATVSSTGKVIAVGKGFATISAYNKNGASTCLVYVNDKVYNQITTENELRKKVANTINEWIGTKEGSKNYQAILKIYNNSTNIDRVAKEGEGWCGVTVSTAWLKLGIAQYICYGFNCNVMKEQAAAKGIWVEKDNYVPKVGDAVLFDWDDNGVGDNTGTIDHIGLITFVNGNSFIVTEGNYDHQVKTRTMTVNSRYIRGFITPNYAYIAKHAVQTIPVPSISIQGVGNGKWLNVATNGSTYTGIFGKGLVAFATKVSSGTIEYCAHVKGGSWLKNVSGWNYKDSNNGYSGNGNPAEKGNFIDAIKINYKTSSEVINKYGYYKAVYRVHILGGDWLDWQYDTETTNGQDGYAGIFGKTIDAIEVKLVKA